MKNLIAVFILLLSANAYSQKDSTYMEVKKVVFNDEGLGDLIVTTPDRDIVVKIKDNNVVITNVNITETSVNDSKFRIIEVLNDYEDYKSFFVERNKTKYYIEFDFTEKIKAVYVRNESGNILVSYMR